MPPESSENREASYRDLKAWQLSMDLAVRIYRQTADFPSRETYGLAAQLREAAVSIPSNLAEGRESKMPGIYLRHVRTARGSVAEVETQLEIVRRTGLLSDDECRSLIDHANDVGGLITGLESFLAQNGD